MKFLVDTNVISEMSKPQPEPSVARWLASTPLQDVALSVITLGEVKRGILAAPSEQRRNKLQHWYDHTFLRLFEGRVLDLTPAVMDEWAWRYQAARTAGNTPASLDSLIAATAAAHGLTVVTRNESDFAPMQVSVLNLWKEE